MKYQTSLTCCCMFLMVLVSVFPKLALSAPNRQRNSGFSSLDYVESDSEYRQLLDLLENEDDVKESLASDPRNFVKDDASVEDIVRMIENNDTATTRNTNQSPTSTRETPDPVTTTQEREQAESTETPEDTPVKLDCPICLEPLKSEPFEFLACAHGLHENCLKTWEITVS